MLTLFDHDPLRAFRLTAPLFFVRRRDTLEIIEVVEVGGIELVDRRIDISRYTDVDQEEWPPPPTGQR